MQTFASILVLVASVDCLAATGTCFSLLALCCLSIELLARNESMHMTTLKYMLYFIIVDPSYVLTDSKSRFLVTDFISTINEMLP